VDGEPLTDNVVFVSDQRVLALKRTAVLLARSRSVAYQDDSFSCFSSFLFRHSGSLVIRTHHEYGGIDSMVCPNETTSGPI